jgi:AmiR/NasT family two-component response regulator
MKPNPKSYRILVVEDEAIVSADIQDCLRSYGYEVAGIADTGEDAIRLAVELEPDVILMDVMLNGPMMGTEAAAKIQATSKVPVVYLTANSNDATLFSAIETSPYGYIVKPFEPLSLRTNIEIAVFKHRAEREREALIKQLQAALAEIKTLKGMLPICGCCKRIRDDAGYWNQIEAYITRYSQATFSHGYCPACAVKTLEESGVPVPDDMRREAEKSLLAH